MLPFALNAIRGANRSSPQWSSRNARISASSLLNKRPTYNGQLILNFAGAHADRNADCLNTRTGWYVIAPNCSLDTDAIKPACGCPAGAGTAASPRCF
jgi:hypothetical protein